MSIVDLKQFSDGMWPFLEHFRPSGPDLLTNFLFRLTTLQSHEIHNFIEFLLKLLMMPDEWDNAVESVV